MELSKEEKFALLKSFNNSFSTSAKAIGMGFSSLVIDMGDGTVSKFYHQNRYSAEQNRQALRNEAHILHALNGHVGDFTTPILTGDFVIYEESSPIAEHFLGHIPMTKLSGHEPEWHYLTQQAAHHELNGYLHDMGSLVASIHDEAIKYDLTSIRALSGFEFNYPWIKNPELLHEISLCAEWLKQNQQEGFIHADLSGRNLKIDKNNRIQSVFDFAVSGMCRNHIHDFHELEGAYLDPAIEGYESTSGRKLDRAVIEMTRIQHLGAHISNLVALPEPPKELEERKTDFEKWVHSITKDLALQ